MRKAQLGVRSRFKGAVNRAGKTLNPWGRAVAKRLTTGATPTGITRYKTRKPSGSAVRRPTPDPQLKGMQYPKNDPLAWPLESPQTRSDLNRVSGMTQDKADFWNGAVDKAFERGGYS